MPQRRVGAGVARKLAACGSLADAVRLLAPTHYGGDGTPEPALARVQHAVADTVLWDLRVLAGWLPGDGARMLRTLASWFELANVDELLQAMTGRPVGPEFRLGAPGHRLAQVAPGNQRRGPAPDAGRLALARPGRGQHCGRQARLAWLS